MSEITIIKEDDGRRGRYVATVAGIAAEAELTFTHRGPGQISADHTGAPDALKGTGVAAALADHLVADARASGFKIIPLWSLQNAASSTPLRGELASHTSRGIRSDRCMPG